MVPVIGRALERERRFREVRLLLPLAVAVGLVAERAAVVTVHSHLAVAMEAVGRNVRRIDRDARMVDPEPIALRVAVGEEAPLQHLVGGKPETREEFGGVKAGLLAAAEVVFRLA